MPRAPRYRERLWPAAWVFLATALVIPASLLVFLPISTIGRRRRARSCSTRAIVVLLCRRPRPTVEVDDRRRFAAGARALPRRRRLGAPRRSRGRGDARERGVGLDARAWLLLRGWIPGVVRVELDDPSDPTPYWLVSPRHPDALAAALDAARDAADA